MIYIWKEQRECFFLSAESEIPDRLFTALTRLLENKPVKHTLTLLKRL